MDFGFQGPEGCRSEKDTVCRDSLTTWQRKHIAGKSNALLSIMLCSRLGISQDFNPPVRKIDNPILGDSTSGIGSRLARTVIG
jgi:hypothetical protein